MCAQQSVIAERNYFAKHGKTCGLKVTSAHNPSSLPTLSVRRGLRSSPVGLGNYTWLTQGADSLTQSAVQHLSTAHAAQHGATEGNDAQSYRASSAIEFHVHGCDVFEDRDLVQVLVHQVGRGPPAKYLGHSEIIQSDVLLDPQILDVRVLDLARTCASADALGGRRLRVNDWFLLKSRNHCKRI